MSRKRIAAVAVALVLIGAGAIAWNEAQNAAARSELDDACVCARRGVHETLIESAPILGELFERDEPMVRGFLRDEVESLCTEVGSELAPWSWNLGRTFTPSSDPERIAELRAAIDRARPRCPSAFDVGEARANELCDALFSGLAQSREPSEPASVWAWPEGIRSSMCAATNGARFDAPDGP